MDMNEGYPWMATIVDRVERLLSFWHSFRTPSIAAISLVALLTLLFRKRGKFVFGQQVSSKESNEKPGWLDGVENGDFDSTSLIPQSGVPPKPSTLSRSSRTFTPKVVVGQKPLRDISRNDDFTASRKSIQPLIFFSSLTGTTERLSRNVASVLSKISSTSAHLLPPHTHDLSYVDLDDYFISGPHPESSNLTVQYFYLLLIPSYDIDSILTTFISHLDETHNDFRIDTAPLSRLAGYSVFGVGDKEGWPTEERGFCSQAIEVDKWMAKLTCGKRAYPLGLGDVKDNIGWALQGWTAGLSKALQDIDTDGSLGEGVQGSGAAAESGDEDDEAHSSDVGRRQRQKNPSVIDVEDVGGRKNASVKAPIAIDFTTHNTTSSLKVMVPKESPTYNALTKQGYTIVGTHSGVKICRWTKSALRGRGSCYKNSFYGIASHLCMETTPSLSCSNKCVFCWRHGTNPVSTTWRWQVDDPRMIFEGAKEGHYKKIKMMRGVPGVRADRFEEAMNIKHCALSLVGEPIFYPHINEFVGMLHDEKISSFLVCNAQHPDQLQRLQRVTQLYVSIDASNRESLKRIDRPLHRDFWERFQACLDILREKRFIQRTVFRLTLVKGFNVDDEFEGYADLVQKGLPCFVEIKGVTFCGTSTSAGAGLTMQNVPFYEEVVVFVEALNKALERRGLKYGIAAEHAHSCCVLLASERFLVDGKWHTVIDYDRFFELLETGKEFGPEDYCKPTPEWALWGKGGFDPRDQRVDRKGRPKVSDAGSGEKAKVVLRTGEVEF